MKIVRSLLFLSFLALFLAALGGETLLAQGNATVREVQTRLAQQGFDPGPIDGLMGSKTRQAVRAFQQARGLASSGSLDNETRRALGVEVQEVVVPSGTRVLVRLSDRLSSGTSQAGDQFQMIVDQGVAVGNSVPIPRGAVITGRVVEAEAAQRPEKGGKLVLQAEQIRIQDQTVRITGDVTAEEESLEGEGSLREDLTRIGIGAAAGGALGGVLGGRRGALIGIAVGAGGTFLATKGEQVELESETRLIVALTQPVTLPEVR